MEGKTGVAQINSIAGAFEDNSKKIAENIKYAENKGIDITIFSKYSLVGSFMEDVFERHPYLIDENIKWLKELAKLTKHTTALLYFTENPEQSSVAVLKNGTIAKIFKDDGIFTVNGTTYGVTLSQDFEEAAGRLKQDGAEVIIYIAAIPSRKGQTNAIMSLLSHTADKYNIPVIYSNQVGATDGFSFDGGSTIFNKKGEIISRAKSFEEDFIFTNSFVEKPIKETKEQTEEDGEFTLNYDFDLERTYNTIIQGIRDYYSKCGLKRAVIGLSGGLDSTICAVLLTDALGKENVLGISMPSKLTSNESKSDAKLLAENLGIHYAEQSIKPMVETGSECLNSLFEQVQTGWKDRYKESYTQDNIQARARAMYLFGVSNEFPFCIPIATSDKSEAYMGYATINGDMSGGFAPIADVTKTKLFALARWLNKNRSEKNAIPESIILKKPGAELAINKETGETLKAEEALMPYEFLDEIIWRIEMKGESYKDMAKAEFLYEKLNKISKEQKIEWLDKFYSRMSKALCKWILMPTSMIVDTNSINGAEYSQPVTSGRINYKGHTEEEISSILNH